MDEESDHSDGNTIQVLHGWRAAPVSDPVTFLLLDDERRPGGLSHSAMGAALKLEVARLSGPAGPIFKRAV